MNTQQQILQVTKDNALQAYQQADGLGKSLLVNLFGKKHFCTDMMELIDSFQAACDFNNTNPNDPKFTAGTVSGNHMEMIAEVAKALNGGKVMQPGEKRWYPYFEYVPSGFRLGAAGCAIARTCSDGGPRLCFASEKLALYAGNTFLPFYDKFLNY